MPDNPLLLKIKLSQLTITQPEVNDNAKQLDERHKGKRLKIVHHSMTA